MICPNCGEENPDRARFCLACATPLVAQTEAPREVRKTVTIVFTDLAGSTAMGERLDPESLRRVMGRYFDQMRAVLERHGGTVEKFIGDAIMAVFGIPMLHEDDALRAVRSANEMRSALASLNEELERDWDVRIAVRTGVNTGKVVAGDPTAGQTLATGDAVNVAARLEQTAQADEILIGSETYQLVRDAVEVEPVEPLTLKGKSQPVPAYRLLGVAGEAGHVRRLDSPMVGRTNEFELLEHAFERVARERACNLFTILGSAGVGKSRLIEELCATVEEKAQVLRGRCLPYGEGITFWPLVEIVKELGVDDAAGLARLLDGLDDAELIAKRVAGALGLVDDTSSPDEIFWAVRKLFEARAQDRPLVLVFDDVHWAEPTLLDLIEHVADWSRGAPLLVVCTARPDLLDARSGWGGGKLNATSILLEPLNEDECEVLIENLLGRAKLADSVRARIGEAAEGNPLFVEEMLSMLIDDGALRRENGRWVPAGDLGDVTIPPTIQSLLAARLDRLHGEERAVIERASVEGKVFHRGAVVELSPEPARAGVGGHLMTLVRKELIRPDRSDVPGDDAFRFRHILIRDAAYEAMPKQTRAELHEEFAGWLERRAGESHEYEEILGYHLEQAYRYRLELGPAGEREHELAHRAAQPLASAGRRAVKRGDVRAAVTLLSRARDLLPDDDPARIALLPDLGTAFGESGDLPRAEAVLTEAVTRARESGDRGTEMRAALERARLRSYTDPASWGEAIDTAERAAGVFEELKDERGLAASWQLIAGIRFNRGELSAHGAAIERALPHAERSGAESTLAALVAHRCSGALHGPVPVEEAIQIHEEALERVRALRSRHIEGALLLSLGRLRGMGGDYDEARALIAQGRSILDEMGLELMAAMAPAEHLGFVAGLFRDFETAEDAFRNGYEMLERMGEKGYLSTIAAALAQTLTERGSYDEAERFSEISEEAAAADDVWSQILWRCARARTRAQRGDLDQAEVLAREGLGLAMETEIVLLQGEAFETLAHVLRLRADADAAAEALRQAVDLYERKGIVPAADTARAELAELAGDRAPAG